MKTNDQKNFLISGALFALFLIYTAGVMFVDRQPLGVNDTEIGFASINVPVHQFLGSNMLLYTITDWLGLVAIFIMLGFGVLGLVQLIKRKSIKKVDSSILVLGVYYVVVLFFYLFFEMVVINYRPVLIDGRMEASYPSSTALLILCVIPTTMLQFRRLIENSHTRTLINCLLAVFGLAMVAGRLTSGVHWLSDIIGSIILAAAMVMLYYSITESITSRKN